LNLHCLQRGFAQGFDITAHPCQGFPVQRQLAGEGVFRGLRGMARAAEDVRDAGLRGDPGEGGLREGALKGSVLDNGYSLLDFLRRYSKWFRWPRVPIPSRSAIQPTVSVVSARNRAANATFTASPCRILKSASCHRRRFNSPAMICSASASAVSARSWP
jgi:hypothetical protein